MTRGRRYTHVLYQPTLPGAMLLCDLFSLFCIVLLEMRRAGMLDDYGDETKLPVGGWGGGVVMQSCDGGGERIMIRLELSF